MSRQDESRQGNPRGSDERGADRRGSCRYSVDEVPALLSWWESSEWSEEHPGISVESTPIPEAVPRPKSFDANTYSAIMARGPAFRGAAASPLAQRACSQPAAAEPSSAASPAVGSLHAAVKPKPAPPIEHERPEARTAAPKASHESTVHACRARILDISQTGISLLSDAIPREGQPIWVRLEGTPGSDWVEGTLRGVSQRDPGTFLVRLAFREGCPYDFFKLAVYGSGGS